MTTTVAPRPDARRERAAITLRSRPAAFIPGIPPGWTTEQVETVFDLYHVTRPRHELAQQLGISETQLRTIADLWGLTRFDREVSHEPATEYCGRPVSTDEINDRYDGRDERYLSLLREDPDVTVFTDADRECLRRWWSRLPAWKIALVRGHTETACMVEARRLRHADGTPVRHAARAYPLRKSALWLGLEEAELLQLIVETRPAGKPVVLPTARGTEPYVLADALRGMLAQRLSLVGGERDADAWFLAELHLSAPHRNASCEDCVFRAHDRTCANVELPAMRGAFCDPAINGPECTHRTIDAPAARRRR
ncbi:hypothetical protein GKE82_23865 [Conexibacter sp. W3-3-2]|uniref:hypothetical protein n=1 Tax=Conexibacter sp. W3-3-2 TaxID=2675227 RepID=UPI0012B7A148|nr:hypothetical protein [Conexibacter sp. W3-3-2]MTD47244.1 hypothetical protein [Conexibacter sp. W3-3-2]